MMEQNTIQQTEKTAGDFVKVGNILYTCWGYEQTNTEFFKVVKILGKRFFLVQELKADVKETGFMSGNATPTDEAKGEPIRAYCDKQGYMSICEKGYKRGLYLHEENQTHHISWYG